jgi:Flp pilus assembly protein TadG
MAAVELAVFLPLLVFLGLIACDFSRLFYAWVMLNNCARNGALYANTSSIAAGTPYSSTTAAAQANWGTNLSTAPTVSTASGTDANGYPYTAVTVSYTFTTLVNYPAIPNSVTLSRTVRMITTP